MRWEPTTAKDIKTGNKQKWENEVEGEEQITSFSYVKTLPRSSSYYELELCVDCWFRFVKCLLWVGIDDSCIIIIIYFTNSCKYYHTRKSIYRLRNGSDCVMTAFLQSIKLYSDFDLFFIVYAITMGRNLELNGCDVMKEDRLHFIAGWIFRVLEFIQYDISGQKYYGEAIEDD